MHKIIEIFADRAALHTEILALRQQVGVLKRQRPRPSLRKADRVFWVILSCLWPGWRHALVIVRPETVIGWHRKGFRLFWTWKSRRGKPGRPPVSREIRYLTRRLRVLTHPALLVVDEIGYLPVNQDGAVLFFQLINARHERASTVLTSNKGFEDWGGVLGDEVMAAAGRVPGRGVGVVGASGSCG